MKLSLSTSWRCVRNKRHMGISSIVVDGTKMRCEKLPWRDRVRAAILCRVFGSAFVSHCWNDWMEWNGMILGSVCIRSSCISVSLFVRSVWACVGVVFVSVGHILWRFRFRRYHTAAVPWFVWRCCLNYTVYMMSSWRTGQNSKSSVVACFNILLILKA